MLAGCTPGLVLEEVDSVIESALPSTSLAEEPSDTPVELEESLSESSPNSTGDSPVDGNALNDDEPGEPEIRPALGASAGGSRILAI